MAKFEGKVNVREIWIVSPDLELDAVGRTFRSVTRKNLEKGIKYTFIVPRSELVQSRIYMLEGEYKRYSALVRIKQVPESDFRLLAVTHIDIYTPNTAEARVFLQLPVKQRGYWIELSRDDAHSLIGRFGKIAEDESLT